MGSSFFDLFSYPNQSQTVLYFYIYAYLGAVVKEIVEQLLNGKYFYAERNLDFSTPRVELYLGAGESVEGSFTIFGSEERLLVGEISSTELRMQVITRDFSGTPYEASYRFDATGLSKGDVKSKKIRVEFSLEDIDTDGFKKGATYNAIRDWIKAKYGYRVTNLNIAQVKQKHGIIERENYNKPKSPDSKQPGCPEEKVKAIEDAMRHFQMI